MIHLNRFFFTEIIFAFSYYHFFQLCLFACVLCLYLYLFVSFGLCLVVMYQFYKEQKFANKMWIVVTSLNQFITQVQSTKDLLEEAKMLVSPDVDPKLQRYMKKAALQRESKSDVKGEVMLKLKLASTTLLEMLICSDRKYQVSSSTMASWGKVDHNVDSFGPTRKYKCTCIFLLAF